MNSTFRSTALALFIGVLSLTLLLAGGALWLQARGQAYATAEQRLASGMRVLGELYATRRTQNVLEGRRLVGDAALRTAARARDAGALSEYLTGRYNFEDGRFAAVLSADGDLLALVGDGGPAADLDTLAGLARQAEAPRIQVGAFDGRLFQFAVTPFPAKDAVAVNGFALERHLSGRIRDVTGLLAGVRASSTPYGSTFQGTPGLLAASATVTLDSLTDAELVADLAITESEAFADLRTLAWQGLALAAAAIGVGALLLSMLLTRLVRRHLERPLKSLREGFRRAMDGDYGQPVVAPPDTPYGPMIRAFNDMQSRVAEREGRIVHHAQYDSLTGLTNRSVVDERIKLALAKAQRTGGAVAAISMDLTRFNEVNGSLGHDVGDEVLKEVARRLASNTRVSDTVARVGGDEFFILLEDTDEKLARHMAEFFVAAIEAPVRVGGHEVRLYLHAGLALYPSHCDTMEALRRMANIALLTAKEQKKRVVSYEPGQDERQLRELAIIHDLPSAIANGELYLQYQPKIDIETQRVDYVEALVRWRHPQLGFIPPDEFIALLEKSGTIANLTEWVFKEAVRQSSTWSAAGYDIGVAVNISANDLTDEGLAGRMQTLLRHHLVEASRVAIEVTESAVISDPERSVTILKEFQRIGCKIALDDFGTGQTSLALLKQLPLTELKIDKSFVQSLRANSGDAIIVKSIIDLGHNMGLVVTAEGVESNYCWNLLNSYGCDLVQGYLVSAPLTADELTEWLLKLHERNLTKIDFDCVPDVSAAS